LTRPIVNDSRLEAEYRDMILDGERERDAIEWTEGLLHDSLAGDNDAAR